MRCLLLLLGIRNFSELESIVQNRNSIPGWPGGRKGKLGGGKYFRYNKSKSQPASQDADLPDYSSVLPPFICACNVILPGGSAVWIYYSHWLSTKLALLRALIGW